MGWIDVSMAIADGMPVYPGDPPVSIRPASSLEAGDEAAVSSIRLGSHTGTHVDAPAHFLPGGAGVDALPLGALIGPAHLVDVSATRGDVGPGDLAGAGLPAGAERVLLRTRGGGPRTGRDPVGLTEPAARELVARGVRLVGIDDLSIAPADDPGPTHRALLGAGVVIVEGLRLGAAAPGAHAMVCLPLRIAGGDGAPARVLLRPAGAGAAGDAVDTPGGSP